MPSCTETVTGKEKVMEVYVEAINTHYADEVHERRATIKLSRN